MKKDNMIIVAIKVWLTISTFCKIIRASESGNDEGFTLETIKVNIEEEYDDELLTAAKRMHYIASAVIGPILVCFGLIGNSLSILVWTRRNMRSSTGRYLTFLAIADSGVLLWFFLVDSLLMIHPELSNSVAYATFFVYFGYPIFFLWVILAIWIIVGVTVDRFIMVCLITRAKLFCNEHRANVGVFIISSLCFIINLPHFWSFHVDFNRGLNSTDPALLKTDFQLGDGGIRYEFWVHCIFLVLAPWFSVFILNMMIIQKLSSTNRKMVAMKTAQSAKKSNKSENQVTRLLLIVTFTFLVLIGFQCIVQCFYMLMPSGLSQSVIDEAYSVAKMGIIVNSSINFILYCFTGRRFRNELVALLRMAGVERLYSSSNTSPPGTRSTGTSGNSAC